LTPAEKHGILLPENVGAMGETLMFFDKMRLPGLFSQKDYTRGLEYYRRGQVHDIQVTRKPGGGVVSCTVTGSEDYQVKLYIDGARISVYCDCPRYEDKHICKHIAAAMLACSDLSVTSVPIKSDQMAERMLRTYVERGSRQPQQIPNKLARLVPCLHPGGYSGDYPSFSFQVGFEKLYVVRDVKKFVDNVLRGETASYGKGLTLCHAPEQFDTRTQALLNVLTDQFLNGRTMKSSVYSGYYETVLFSGYHQKSQITLTGSAFDRVFDLLRDEPVASDSSKREYRLDIRDPDVTLSLERLEQSAHLKVTVSKGPWKFFGSAQNLYAISEDQVLRCSRKFRENIYPLLRDGAEDMWLSLSDLPIFCGCVLPEVQDAVTVLDPDQLLQENLPDECVPCFYFDMEDETLLLRLDFRYSEETFNCFGQPKSAVKRDIRAEQTALRFVESCFPQRSDKHFTLTGSDAVYDFLTDGLGRFQDQGEVFLSDRLRGRRIQPTRAAVGLSVSDGLLCLDFDTGGFPPEELEALYQSLLKRRRYHKLADGRYLPLDGSSCETLSEMAHMLQLSAKDLIKGQVRLPVFRALYLDGLLSGSEDVQVSRSRQFREMIRDFKAVQEGDYALPEGLESTLRPYQKVGFQWLKTLEHYGFGGILADEMGLGKTLQMIAFLASVPPENRAGPNLVVCPASLILNWGDEMDKFVPGLSYTLIMGTAAERKKQIAAAGGTDVWVTSYELLRQDIEQYAALRFTCCVLDEAQYIKNQSTMTSKAVKRIDCRQRFVMTGTPIENRLSELWNLFDFLMPGYLFSHTGFVSKLEKPAVKSGDKEAMEQLRRMVRPFLLRRMKQDVLKELPPKIEYVRRISLSEEERKVYCASSAAARQSLESGEGGKMAILAALTELRQICCAPELCFENYEGPSSKLDACIELCAGMAENGHQILLFSQFTSMLDRIRARLDELHISHFTLQGSTPKAQRAALVKSFNAGGASVFLISLKAGGTGLNLTAADVVIHYDPWWNPAVRAQATDRAHRIGQRSSVQVYDLIAKDTVEEKILDLQSRKAELMDAVTGGAQGGILNMSKEELLALFD